MPFNVMLQLCKITRSSKLFQRNFFLPLLKPLSPKDALRRKIITGKNLLGNRIEHYIPVLEEYQARLQRRKYMVKGQGKKRQRKKSSMKYLMPFFDNEMEYHGKLQGILARKSKGRGQCYTYFVPDKNCTLVFTHQMERAIRDHDILDVIIAQRSEKIVVKLPGDIKVTLPLIAYDGNAPLYAGEGWTRKELEEYHHHGKETMSIARLFEAKESGVEEWELEMMRMASKRKKKQKGEGTKDWKSMMTTVAENMDWDQFEEDTKQIVAEANEPVDDEPISMAVNDMDKTKNVNEKLKAGGEAVLRKLPVMTEIPEIIKIMPEGELSEIVNVSGVRVKVPSSGIERFVAGQMVKSEDGELFVPGQTVENNGVSEYTPGFTVLMDNEPTLLPGLVMGDDPNKPMFLPGESTITDTGELQFTETEDDIKREPTPPPVEEEPEIEEVELEEEQNSEEEQEEKRPPPKREKKELIYERPKRQYPDPNMGVKRREKAPKKPLTTVSQPPTQSDVKQIDKKEPVIFDLTLPTFEKDLLEQEKERVSKLTEKKSKEEYAIDRKKREILMKAKELSKVPPPPKYEPLEPVTKSAKLKEYEKNIRKGKFFDTDYKKFLNKDRGDSFNWKEKYDYRNTFDTVGIQRHRVWKSVY